MLGPVPAPTLRPRRTRGTRSSPPTCGSARPGWTPTSPGTRTPTAASTASASPAATSGGRTSSSTTSGSRSPRPGGAARGHHKFGAGERGPGGGEAVILAGLGGTEGPSAGVGPPQGTGPPREGRGMLGGCPVGVPHQPPAPLGLGARAAAPRPPLPQRRRPVQRLDGDQRGAALRRAHHVGLARHHQELLQGGRLLLPLRRAAVPPHLRLLDLQREPDRPPQPAGRGRPDGLRGERGVGGAGHAGHEERRHLRVLLGALPRRHLHAAAQAARLLLHLQPAPALRHDLLPGAPGLLPPGRLGGEGLAGGDGAAGPHRLPAAGGGEHAAVGERAAHR